MNRDAASCGVLDSVLKQLHEHLVKARAIGKHRWHSCWHIHMEPSIVGDKRLYNLNSVSYLSFKIHLYIESFKRNTLASP
jgi:hypothetical protein